jgi:hypothetical protein
MFLAEKQSRGNCQLRCLGMGPSRRISPLSMREALESLQQARKLRMPYSNHGDETRLRQIITCRATKIAF